MKDSTDYGVLERRPVPERGAVQRDEIIFLYKLARQERDLFLRRIEVWDEPNQRTLVFLTNHRRFAASTEQIPSPWLGNLDSRTPTSSRQAQPKA